MKKITTFITVLTILAVICLNTSLFAVKHVVLVSNFTFTPSSLSVTVGDTVRWEWSSGSHTTTSGVIPGGAASWDHPITSSNTFYEYPVTIAGTFNYVCTPHASMGMVATFTAADLAPTLSVSPSNRAVTAASGTTTFSVTSNSSWTSSSDAAWCIVTPSGNGNGSITAIFEANPTNAIRVATITTAVAGMTPQTVTVTQAVSTVGIDEQATTRLQVYPNPSTGVFKFKTGTSKDQASEVNVMDITGRSIISGNYPGATECTVDLSSQPKGCYFIQVKNATKSTVVRLILAN